MTIEAAQIQRVLSPELRDLLTLSVQQVLPSTNAYLLQQPMRNQQWSVVIAQQQTQGRGQRDHQFVSPIGGLYLSLLMPVREPACFNAFQQTAAAGVALAETIQALLHYEVQLKWVNDVYDQQQKLAGILTESYLDVTGRLSGVVVGIGLNFASTIETEYIGNLRALVVAQQVTINQFSAQYLNRLYTLLQLPALELTRRYQRWTPLVGRKLQTIAGQPVQDISVSALKPDGTLILSNQQIVRIGQRVRFAD